MRKLILLIMLCVLTYGATASITYVQNDYNDFNLSAFLDIGRAGNYVGDFDNDTLPEVALSLQTLNSSLGGFIMVEFMANGSINDYTIFDNSSIPINLIGGDRLGQDIDSIGDFDGDGVTDLIISGSGQQYATYSPFYSGAIYLFLMNSNYTVKQVKEISSESGGFSNVSRDSYDYIGTCLTNLGDVDNDGVNDILFSKSTGFSDGGLYVALLNSDFTVKSSQFINRSLFGTDTSVAFGQGCQGVGDVSGDGIEDFIVNGGGNIFVGTLTTSGTLLSYGIYNESDLVGSEQGSFANGISNHDMNNDTIMDYLVGNGDGAVGDYSLVMLMNPTGTVNDTLKIDTVGVPNDDFGGNQMPLGDLNNDGFQDMLVISVESSDMYVYFLNITNQATQSYPNTSLQCDDGTDNDGDGFTDYPSDPSCTSITDDTENPFDSVQCNDGIDNDGDGFIDYPTDPSCSASTDDTESPRDDSPSPDEACYVEEGCLLKDAIAYTDELNLHGWYNTIGSVRSVNIYGSNRIYFDTDSDTVRFNMSKDITNPNDYEMVNSEAEFFIDIGGVGILFDDTNYTFYWEHLDFDGNMVNSIRFDISRANDISVDFVKVLLYNYNGTAYEQVGYTIYPAHDSSSRIQFFLTFDQTLKTYDLGYIEEGSPLVTVTDLPWANVLASKIHSLRLRDVNSIDDSKVDVYVDEFSIYSDDISYTTVCDEWELPYYLTEGFNGYPLVCDWNSNLNIFFTGTYRLFNTTSYYYIQKELPDDIEDINSRYISVKWDAEFDSILSTGSTTLRLYDDEFSNFLTVYWLDNLDYYYNNDGSGTLAQGSIPLGQSYEYQIIIDMQDDDYDLFFNGSEVVSGGEFTDDFYNLEIMSIIKISSAFSDVTLDNLEIYASTEDGTPLIPSDEITPSIEDETTFCGHVYIDQPSCIDDDDCDSGKCLVNNKCARWDANYCTENGWVYGNKCFLAGSFSCALTSTGDIITDNFFLFLILLVLVMFAVYLTIMFRRS